MGRGTIWRHENKLGPLGAKNIVIRCQSILLEYFNALAGSNSKFSEWYFAKKYIESGMGVIVAILAHVPPWLFHHHMPSLLLIFISVYYFTITF